jgi:hypothetical protein
MPVALDCAAREMSTKARCSDDVVENFVGIGAQIAGTTWLGYFLPVHPIKDRFLRRLGYRGYTDLRHLVNHVRGREAR